MSEELYQEYLRFRQKITEQFGDEPWETKPPTIDPQEPWMFLTIDNKWD